MHVEDDVRRSRRSGRVRAGVAGEGFGLGAGELAEFLESGAPPIVFTLGSSGVFDAGGFYHAAADAVTGRVGAHAGPGEAVTLRYSPGYCGMAITQQRVLFGLVDAEAAGITLLPSMLMRPLKSVSGIVGLGAMAGPGAAAPVSPCDACARIGCHMRR